ncbi:prolyl oligopeptidase family serine peptidase [Singulisphaera sp. Ch08]|uniref:Prolyl oligopeptidase family serine peptidase n=1 Tax=Singulisphaera sp. Ch08 TaxID=3120278 RepID=A0AAU7CET0_9BACT
MRVLNRCVITSWLIRCLVGVLATSFSSLPQGSWADEPDLNAQKKALRNAEGVVPFRGRSIDVMGQLTAFPYDVYRWEGSLRHKKLVFLERRGGKQLVSVLDLDRPGESPATLDQSRLECDRDWSRSLTFHWKVRKRDGVVFLTADENNNEAFNLYRLDPVTRAALRLTNVAYITDFSFSPDDSKIAYIERMGKEGERCRLHVLELETLSDRVVAEDSQADRFTWSNVSWQPEGKALVLTTLRDGDRNRGNLTYVSLAEKEIVQPRNLTDPTVPRTFPEALKHWYDPEQVLIKSSESGVQNIYRLNVQTGQQTRLTDLTADVDFAEVTTIGSVRYLVVSVPSPLGTTLYRYNLSEDPTRRETVLESSSNIHVMDLDGDRILAKKTSAVEPILVEEITLADAPATARRLAGLTEEVERKVVHSEALPVLFDTFEGIEMPLRGRKYRGKLHGFLYMPKHPLPREQQLVMVQSFYGGENRFDPDVQIWCDAGLYVFSPAPRGSSLFTSTFEQANDGDLGGKETVDVMRGAQFVSKKLGIPPSRVGVYGHSHGGYATLRQLTFPGAVDGIRASFDWGFGVSMSGFASIKNEYDFSNIKQWIVKEAGDPSRAGVRQQWEDRSPINHADQLRARLLLIHGTADERVPYSESQSLYDRLVTLGKKPQVRLLPLEGTGHVYTSDEDRFRVYREIFAFLESLP